MVVGEFSSDGENVPTRHPAMEEQQQTALLARWSERDTATLGLVKPMLVRDFIRSSETMFSIITLQLRYLVPLPSVII